MEHRTIYYVSDAKGDDRNEGTSKEKPLKTLLAVSSKALCPGDEIRLERGSVFEGQYLHLHQQQGEKEKPIIIGCYGEGSLPVIAAGGNGIWYQNYGAPLDAPTHVWKGYVSSCILLYDCEYIRVEELELTNISRVHGEYKTQADRMNRTGVSVIAKDRGTLHDIELSGLHIHDIDGNVYDKHINNGGIYLSALTPEQESITGIARYDGVYIHHCRIERVRRWGLAVGYTYKHHEFTTLELPDEVVRTYGSVNVLVEHNELSHIGGDGITTMYCFRPKIQYNRCEFAAEDICPEVYTEAGERGGMVAAAIWPWKCKDALFQYNVACDTGYNQDGEAWDCDSGDGTVYQYNYSRGNGGGCVMFCEGESIHNTFRYNLSENDRVGTLTPVRNVDAHIHDNIFLIPEGTPFIRQGMSGGGMLVENNHIIYTGEAARDEDWYHQTEQAVYHNNIYCNYQKPPAQDSSAELLSKEEYGARDELTKKKEEMKHEKESR